MDEKLKKLHSKESRQKAKETRMNNIRQFATPEEQETLIILDYYDNSFIVDSNKATVLNRMARKGYEYVDEDTYDGEICRRKYRLPFSDLGKFVRLDIFGVKSKNDTIVD